MRLVLADNAAWILILTTFGLDEYVCDALRAWASGSYSRATRPNS